MNIQTKFALWPERVKIPVRLHLYGNAGLERCDLDKLLEVFLDAEAFGIQEKIETNLNRQNAVYVYLDNYVLQRLGTPFANPRGWGDHWGFLLRLIERFPGDVYIDPPEGAVEAEQGTRFALGKDGIIMEEIQTWDDMS